MSAFVKPGGPITVTLPLITESIIFLQIEITPNETAAHLAKRLCVYHPSSLCRWPLRVRLLPDEDVYALLKRGESLYVHSKELDAGSLAERSLCLTQPQDKK